MEESKIQEIRDGFDELFLWSEKEVSEKSKQLFTTLGIEWFADIIARSKKYGYNVSQKILQDLVKVSFVVYSNLDKLPIQRKVILPEKGWSYKFIVASLQHELMRWSTSDNFKCEDTNTLFLASTGDSMHADIAMKMWLSKDNSSDVNVLWWAWIDIDYDKKVLNIHDESWAYGSCSNQLVQWMLEDYQKKWYTVTIGMKQQREFFQESGDISPEILLEKKLELLHSCLMPSQVPEKISKELLSYQPQFDIFKEVAKKSKDPFGDEYIEALTIFRDQLLWEE